MNTEYEVIKNKLEDCQTETDYKNAYKWLAQKFVELNEMSIKFENLIKERFGDRELNILIYGSEEAYNRQLAFQETLEKAENEEEKQSAILDYIMNYDITNIPDYPRLWDDYEEDIDIER